MNESKIFKINDELGKTKTISAVRRMQIVYYISFGICLSNLAASIPTEDFSENIKSKAVYILICITLMLIHNWVKSCESSARLLSFIIGELINAKLIYFAYIAEKDLIIIWGQFAPLIIMHFQSYLLGSTSGKILVSLKHILQWGVANYYFSSSTFFFSPFIVSSILGLFAFIICCCYLEHLQYFDMNLSKENLIQANKKLKSLIEANPKCISVLSSSMEILFFNSTLKNLLNESSIISYLKSIKYHIRYPQASMGNQVIFDIEDSINLLEGTRVIYGVTENQGIFIEWGGKIDMWDDKKVVILIGKNVTDLIKLEKKIVEDEYKSVLLRTVSHELRSPTNAMLAMSECVLDSKELSEENQERVQIIASSCGYLQCLINDLLDYSQIMAGCLKVLNIPFDLPQLLNECLKMFSLELAKLKINSEVKYITDVPRKVITDPHRLKQIIINLLSNSKKFTRHGSISLLVSYISPQLIISCEDTGLGIKEENISKLFHAFGKLEETVSNPQGVGLGLYISNMLAKELGGKFVEIISEPGKGSKFTFFIQVELPRALSFDSEIPEENANVNCPSILVKTIEKMEILIVDDTYFNVLAYVQIFKSEGINCSDAANGLEAIEKIKEKRFDCVIMDCEMPVLNGWDTVKKLKELERTGEVLKLPPIIGSTAHDTDFVKQQCLEAGMDDVIFKPCPKKDIIHKVNHWLGASKFL